MALEQITADENESIIATGEPVVIVTGASSGIGAATAIDLSADSTVIAIGRDADRLDAVAAAGRVGAIVPLVLDLSAHEGIEAALAALTRVDALVNNAAVMFRTTAATVTPAQWHDMLQVNVIAPAELTRVLLDRLRASRGTVVFIGSGASKNPVPGHVAYAASKHALQGYVDSLRMEVAGDGVRVSTVAPGPTATDGAFRMDDLPTGAPADGRMDPRTVARTVRHVIDAPEDTQLTEAWVRPRVERR